MANVQRSIPIGSIERDFFLPRLAYPGEAQHDLLMDIRTGGKLENLEEMNRMFQSIRQAIEALSKTT